MPLSPPAPRQPDHTRRYRFEGFRRDDGLWDIEGHMTDTKSYGFPNQHRGRIEAGEPLHGMAIRLTIDIDFLIHGCEAVTDHAPYAVCPNITPNFARMIGVRIGPGWRQAIRSRLGGVEGCTHLVEMLQAMATVAFQTLYAARAQQQAERGSSESPQKRPGLLDSCHAYRSDGPIVAQQFPDHYTGPGGADSEAG